MGLKVVSDKLTRTHQLQTLPLEWEGGYSAAVTSQPWPPVHPCPHPRMLLEARGLGEWGEEGSRAKGEEGLEEAGQGVTVLAVTLQQQVVQQGTATSAATGQREIGPGVDYLKRLALTVEIHAQVLKRGMP